MNGFFQFRRGSSLIGPQKEARQVACCKLDVGTSQGTQRVVKCCLDEDAGKRPAID